MASGSDDDWTLKPVARARSCRRYTKQNVRSHRLQTMHAATFHSAKSKCCNPRVSTHATGQQSPELRPAASARIRVCACAAARRESCEYQFVAPLTVKSNRTDRNGMKNAAFFSCGQTTQSLTPCVPAKPLAAARACRARHRCACAAHLGCCPEHRAVRPDGVVVVPRGQCPIDSRC